MVRVLETAALLRQSTGGFSELCEKGCAPQMLAASIALFREPPEAEKAWSKIVSGPYKRGKAAHAFENAADIIDDLFKGFAMAEDDSPSLHAAELRQCHPSIIIKLLKLSSTWG